MPRTLGPRERPARYPRRTGYRLCAMSQPMSQPMCELNEPILGWYAHHARELPWRRPEASAWSVLVSEVMLQQTPVARVLPVHGAWLERWPEPADLAAEPAG